MKSLVAAVLALSCATPCAAAQAVEWQRDLSAALERASAAERIVFVDFYARWCGPCRWLERTTFRDSMFIRFASTRVCVRVDAERDTASARRYRISAYPTLMLLRSDGSEIDRIVGALPAAVVDTTGAAERAGINLAEMHYTYQGPTQAVLVCRTWLEKFATSPNRASVLLLLGYAAEAAGDRAAANSAYRTIVEHHPGSPEAEEARDRLEVMREG